MKALISSGVLLLLWVCGYYLWDYSQFHQTSPVAFTMRLPPLKTDQENLWIDFFHSYSFRVEPTTKCSEACCVRLHLLPWQLEQLHQTNQPCCEPQKPPLLPPSMAPIKYL